MVNVTEKAAQEVLKIISEQNLPENTMLRVGVVGGGCSGFSYNLTFDTKADEMTDGIYESHGLKIVVDQKSDIYLDGTSVDFYDGLEKRGFVFNNPNATKSCGCGSSFTA